MKGSPKMRRARIRFALGVLQIAGAFAGVNCVGRYGLNTRGIVIGILCLLPLVFSRLLFYRNPFWGFKERP